MQSHYIFLEVQCPVAVLVEAAEDVLGIRLGVGVREEGGVDVLELLLADAARGELFQKGLVPGVELLLGVPGVQLQILQHLF